jgi:hypothetical protein
LGKKREERCIFAFCLWLLHMLIVCDIFLIWLNVLIACDISEIWLIDLFGMKLGSQKGKVKGPSLLQK